MSEVNKPEVSATGFAPHIEELHEFFRSRGVAFGKPEELKPFVERIQSDESFRDEMASMVRAIIYRERDGLMPAELLELMVVAVTGTPVEDVPEQDQDAVRQMTGFVGGVFRSRWTPGSSVGATDDKANVDVDSAAKGSAAAARDAVATAQAEATARPMTPIFYKAQVVANGGEEPILSEPPTDVQPVSARKTSAARGPKAAKPEEVVLPLRGNSEAESEPFLSLAGYATRAEPVVAFLRGGGTSASPLAGTERRRSSGWGWVVATLAVIVAFGAGMYTRQLMFAHYGAAWPWPWHLRMTRATATPSSPAGVPPVATPGGVQPGGVQAPAVGAGAQDGKATQQRGPAQVEAARSEWKGGSESAIDETEPGAPGSGARASGAAGTERAGKGAAASSAVSSSAGAIDSATPRPMTGVSKPGAEDHTDSAGSNFADSKDARATAMLGASSELMKKHLLFAPEPQYPEQARLAHIEGKVVVEALVGRDGSVVRAQAISGQPALRAAAEKAVYGRRYQPYVENDIPMAVRTLVTVEFPPR